MNILNKIKQKIHKLTEEKTSNLEISKHANPYEWKKPKNKKLIIGTHSGRSGMRWISNVHGSHKGISSLKEPYPLLESFFRYSTFNQLSIDHSGFFNLIQTKIEDLWKDHDCVFYASPWLSFGIDQVQKFLKPDYFITTIRNPKEVVSSLNFKGWYNKKYYNFTDEKVTGLQPNFQQPHHLFSRISPSGKYFNTWNSLTAIGKATWYWVESNKCILNSLDKLDSDKILKFRLEDINQNYIWYKKYAKFFKLNETLSENNFFSVKKNTMNINNSKNKIREWSLQETQDYNNILSKFETQYLNFKSITL